MHAVPLGLSSELLILPVQSVGQEHHKGDKCNLGYNQNERPGDGSVVTEKSKRRVKLQDNRNKCPSYPPETESVGGPVLVSFGGIDGFGEFNDDITIRK
jgi:hypothetical protein